MPERFLDVSHEALIRGWPRLRRWLDEDRAGLRLQRRITDAAEEWQRSNRDNDLLYRGARLIQAQEWRARHESELNPLEREFLDASIVLKQRVEQEKRLHEAETERVKLLLEKRKRTLIFGVTVFVFGIIMLIALTALSWVSYRAWQLSKQKAADLEAQRQALVEKGRGLRENAKAVLASGTDNPIKDVTALRNLALALNSNPGDTEAARLASNLLLQHVWCPPAAPEVRFEQDALLAANFGPGGTNNEVFAMAGNGQLLFWNGRKLSPVRWLFEKPKPASPQQIVQPGFASFSRMGDGFLLFLRRSLQLQMRKLLNKARLHREHCPHAPVLATSYPKFRSGDGRCRIEHTSLRARTWRFRGFEVPASILPGLTSQIALSLSMHAARTRPNVPFFRSREPSENSSIDRRDSLT
jgi:Novel STAND NTPase 1